MSTDLLAAGDGAEDFSSVLDASVRHDPRRRKTDFPQALKDQPQHWHPVVKKAAGRTGRGISKSAGRQDALCVFRQLRRHIVSRTLIENRDVGRSEIITREELELDAIATEVGDGPTPTKKEGNATGVTDPTTMTIQPPTKQGADARRNRDCCIVVKNAFENNPFKVGCEGWKDPEDVQQLPQRYKDHLRRLRLMFDKEMFHWLNLLLCNKMNAAMKSQFSKRNGHTPWANDVSSRVAWTWVIEQCPETMTERHEQELLEHYLDEGQ